MRIRAQINTMVVVAALILPLVFCIGLWVAHNAERHLAEIVATEALVVSANQLRQIALDTVLFHESSAADQWQRKIKGIQTELDQFPTTSPEDKANSDRMRQRIALAADIYPRLIRTPDSNLTSQDAVLVARTISALSVITQEILDTGYELIRRNRAERAQATQLLAVSMMLILLAMAVLIVFFWRLIRGSILLPLREFESGAKRIALGDYTHRLNFARQNEIGDLATAFDNMIARVQQAQCELALEAANSRQAEAAVQESARYTRAILDNVADGILTMNAQGAIQSVNQAIQTIFGYTSKELIGRNIYILLAGSSKVTDHTNKSDTTMDITGIIGRAHEIEGQRHDGTYFPMDLTISQTTYQGQALLIGVARDITWRKQQAQELGRVTERLKVATQAARVGIWEYDVANNRLTWDEVMHKLYGITPETFSGVYDAWRAGVHPDDQIRCNEEVMRALAGDKPFDTSFRVLWPSGELRWIRAVATDLRDTKGLVLRLIGTNWDITAEKQAEQVKAEFVSVVSHELRTPLTSISGALRLVTGGALGDVPPKMQSMLEIAHKNCLRLSHLINDLLDIEKLSAGKMPMDLQIQALMPLVEHAIESTRDYAAQLNVRFEICERDDAVAVKVDGDRLQQVLANLLSNAAKFSPVQMPVQIVVRTQEKSVRVSVIDRGPGIPERFRARIFQKFSQADSSDARQKGGTGLGLVISKELIVRMHGEIGFTSEPGVHTCFYFKLPISQI